MDPLSIAVKVGLSIVPNLALGIVGLYGRAFDRSGAVAGVVLGTLITYGFGPGGFLAMLAFVALGSITTRLRLAEKVARGISDSAGGRRNWRNAAANLGVPAFGALLAIARPMPVVGVFFTAALATAAFDTVATEMGKAYSSRCFTLQNFKIKDAGSPGGISAVGTVSGTLAALGVALIAFGFDIAGGGMLVYIVVAALLASAAESVLKSAAGLRSSHFANVTNALLGGLVAVLFWTGLREI
jgi:uncharacterized protein (TIGR00297 family)